LILTSGRIFELPYGEEKFSVSLGKWLLGHNLEVMLMGSGFASVQVKKLSKSDIKEKTIRTKKIKVLGPPYIVYLLSRLLLTLEWKYNFRGGISRRD